MRKCSIIMGMIGWLCVSGCEDSYESNIPSVSFYFSCDLSQARYYKIKTPGQFLKVDKNINGLPVGYAGLLIGQSVFSAGGEYIAYDAACPVEASRHVSVEVQEDGFGTAQCPKCHATFGLSANGSRNDGKGKESLRIYKVTVVSDNTLQVSN
ncbi:hypothetical protein [Bacteroides sp. UBA939]|uniref:hypothetical protein n=1 Tax=Bacteroides sp. UBA939 TaxID=1946092 RepID=UPI0025B7FA66|nr:hypothetical protein [Bacteroides sp. UBA939]